MLISPVSLVATLALAAVGGVQGAAGWDAEVAAAASNVSPKKPEQNLVSRRMVVRWSSSGDSIRHGIQKGRKSLHPCSGHMFGCLPSESLSPLQKTCADILPASLHRSTSSATWTEYFLCAARVPLYMPMDHLTGSSTQLNDNLPAPTFSHIAAKPPLGNLSSSTLSWPTSSIAA